VKQKNINATIAGLWIIIALLFSVNLYAERQNLPDATTVIRTEPVAPFNLKPKIQPATPINFEPQTESLPAEEVSCESTPAATPPTPLSSSDPQFIYSAHPVNVALHKPARASRSFREKHNPAKAVDGNILEAGWNAGGMAPQWIEIDLIVPRDIYAIELLPNQNPPGNTSHAVYGRANENQAWALLQTVVGYTVHQKVLYLGGKENNFGTQRYLRIITNKSPSWVSWGEIRIYSHDVLPEDEMETSPMIDAAVPALAPVEITPEKTFPTDVSPTPSLVKLVNVAQNKPVRASKTYNSVHRAELTVDGDESTYWQSGHRAPQWIEVDLMRPYEIHTIELLISQKPDGVTEQVIYGRSDEGMPWVELRTLRGYTSDRQLLRLTDEAAPFGRQRYIRIVTQSAPGKVALTEIRIFTPDP